ncbi:MAG: flagellar type III secretion system pore protein FliP [Lachnospiraceae bacterium]|nr:flagellar type III secretion system pore protein FliP [Lachnospiraceae bacterium]
MRIWAAWLIIGLFVLSGPVAVLASIGSGTTNQTTSPAVGSNGLSERRRAGDESVRTNRYEPGQTENSDQLGELNIANDVIITYNNGNGTIAGPIRIMLILTAIAVAPTLLICLTSFTRILIVLHFTRQALNTQSAPPNQVIIGISLFLTYFIMAPIFTQINEEAIKPFEAGQITQEEAIETGLAPLRQFMYEQTQKKDARMFIEISGTEWTDDMDLDDIPTPVLIPAFMVSELRTAFIIGFVIYIPFLVIDMVTASALMAMGMMMLPPTTISMPFKILLFVLADGWNLVIVNLVKTFY